MSATKLVALLSLLIVLTFSGTVPDGGSGLDPHGDTELRLRLTGEIALGGCTESIERRLIESSAGTESASCREVPVQIVVGEGDTVTPSATNAQRYASLIRGARLVVLPGSVGHYTFLHECTARGQELLPICRDGSGVDRAAIHRRTRGLALDFFNPALDV